MAQPVTEAEMKALERQRLELGLSQREELWEWLKELNGGVSYLDWLGLERSARAKLPPLDQDAVARLLELAARLPFDAVADAIDYLGKSAEAGRLDSRMRSVVVERLMVFMHYTEPAGYPPTAGYLTSDNKALTRWTREDPERFFQYLDDWQRGRASAEALVQMGREARAALPFLFKCHDHGGSLFTEIIMQDEEILQAIMRFVAEERRVASEDRPT
jgi:hypothetical protein